MAPLSFLSSTWFPSASNSFKPGKSLLDVARQMVYRSGMREVMAAGGWTGSGHTWRSVGNEVGNVGGGVGVYDDGAVAKGSSMSMSISNISAKNGL